ncbi:FAD-dependent oxidoreductase, partial [Myxococcota bacterium]|nr:FAD-dependent oxidoreductase [Myxococcota bacterium]
MSAHADVAIVGGGPAGAALAMHLARARRDVVLLERDTFPRDKLCGEVLSTEAEGELVRLGVFEEITAAGPSAI